VFIHQQNRIGIQVKKHTLLSSNREYSSPTKRSRPSVSQRLGLTDESDQSDGEPYSLSDDNLIETQQRIIRQPKASLRESTLISTGQPSKAILELKMRKKKKSIHIVHHN
jgi:hypothetical protein